MPSNKSGPFESSGTQQPGPQRDRIQKTIHPRNSLSRMPERTKVPSQESPESKFFSEINLPEKDKKPFRDM